MGEYHRIRCKGSNAVTWICGDPWPASESFPIDPKTGKQAIPDKSDPFVVGRIFFEPEITDAVSTDGSAQRLPDGRILKEDGETVYEQIYAGDAEKTHSYYEVWCVSTSLLSLVGKLIESLLGKGPEPTAQQMSEFITKHPIMTVEIPASEVAAAYKTWDHGAAFKHLMDQIAGVAKAAKDDAEDDEEEEKPKPQAAQ